MSDFEDKSANPESSAANTVDYAQFYTSDPFLSSNTKANTNTDNRTYTSPDTKAFAEKEKNTSKIKAFIEKDRQKDVFHSHSDDVYLTRNSGSVYLSKDSPSSYINNTVPSSYSSYPATGGYTESNDPYYVLAILAFIIGIVGIFCNILSFFVINIIGIILGCLYFALIKGADTKSHRMFARLGIIFSVIGLIIGIAFTVYIALLPEEDEYIIDSHSTNVSGQSTGQDLGSLGNPLYEESKDEFINEYISYFTDFAEKNNLREEDIYITPFSTSSSNCVLINTFGYPQTGDFYTITISHYSDENLYKYIADDITRDRSDSLTDLYNNSYSVKEGEDYMLYTCDDSPAIVFFYGVCYDKQLTVEFEGHYESLDSKKEFLDMLAELPDKLNWPVIK